MQGGRAVLWPVYGMARLAVPARVVSLSCDTGWSCETSVLVTHVVRSAGVIVPGHDEDGDSGEDDPDP
jgi:hypothetical protein